MFTTKTLMPKFERINPVEGFKRIFSSRSLVEMLKAFVKVACLCFFVYSEYAGMMKEFPGMTFYDISDAFTEIMKMSFMIGIKMGGLLGVIAAADYIYQWWRHEKDLMMTKQEVREENKQLEGDPKIKGKIRQKQRQMSRQRMMQHMREADVVITNPTHFAVAVRYKEKEDKAPLVLAKGADHVAAKIRERAKEYGIEIVENKPVAQALFNFCDIGDEIPKDMYKAVAEILVYVYRMKNRARGESV
jgi:flagellar biosynthetic protein FlhB